MPTVEFLSKRSTHINNWYFTLQIMPLFIISPINFYEMHSLLDIF
jgi:hypothetical protein